jgi:hypothetical protein
MLQVGATGINQPNQPFNAFNLKDYIIIGAS